MKNIIISSGVALFLSAAPAFAQSIYATVPKANIDIDVAAPGGVLQNVVGPTAFALSVNPDESYCCSAVADNAITFFTRIDKEEGESFTPVSFVNAGERGNPITRRPGLGNNSTKSRACFYSPTPLQSVLFVGLGFAPSTQDTAFSPVDGTTVANLRIKCDNTTLYGGFNTVAGEFNFLEITNIAGGASEVRVVATDSTDLDKTLYDVRIPLTSARTDVDLHSHVGAGKFGALKLLHNGPAGSVQAAVSEYKIISTSPLNFQLIGRIPLEARSSK